MGADPSTNPRERVLLLDQFQCFFIPSLFGESQIADDVFAGGAVVVTRRGFIHVEGADIPPTAGLVDQGRSEGHGEVGHIGLGLKHNLFRHGSPSSGYWYIGKLVNR
jgi:hypothetical protein